MSSTDIAIPSNFCRHVDYQEGCMSCYTLALQTQDHDNSTAKQSTDFVCRDKIDEPSSSRPSLDRFNIPSTPDSLINFALGLQVFHMHCRALGNRLPAQAIGMSTEPAVMSYGSALHMFGASSMLDVEQEQLGGLTEAAYRQSLSTGTTPLLSFDDQWALFRPRRYGPRSADLARQYVNLVVRKQQLEQETQERRVNNTPIAEKAAGDGPTNPWPDVEGLDWAGFTNWIVRCRNADEQLGHTTLGTWAKERDERSNTICARLKAWQKPLDIDDGASTHPDPRRYYAHPTPVAVYDLQKLGLAEIVPKKRKLKSN